MKRKTTIKAKLVISIISSSVLIFLALIGYMSYKTRVLALDDASNLAKSITNENALRVQQLMSNDLSMLETLADVFSFNKEMSQEEWKELYAKISNEVVGKRGNFVGFSASWEEIHYDTSITENKTRYYYSLQKSSSGLTESRLIKNLRSRLFQNAKSLNQTALLEPSLVREDDGSIFYKFYLSSPIQDNGEFVGYVVGDFSTDNFSEIINKIKPYPTSVAYLISNQEFIVTHPDSEVIGDSLSVYAPILEEQFKLAEVIKQGGNEVFRGVDSLGNKIIVATAPIQVGEYAAPWGLVLIIPQKEVVVAANKMQLTSLVVAFIGILLVAFIIYLIARRIGNDLTQSVKVLEKIAIGDTTSTQNLVLNRNDEIGDIVNSVNVLNENFDKTSEFANAIGQGKLETKFTPLSEYDKLGNSLINMQKSLIKAKDDERLAQIEEEKSRWTAEGLAKFSEIIRISDSNVETLSYNILQHLVDYLGISMGALYVAEDDNDELVFVQQATIAYERRKLINTKIAIGEGLVGRCAFEQLTIYMTNIPDDYITIRSGLGDANPGCLLLVPLISNEAVYGVIELASFAKLDNYKIAFVEKLAENIASTLQSARVNQRTAKLLEQSKLQSEELAAQEEEMRQNMEELQSTQEEARRRESEMLGIIDSVDKSVFKVEYSLKGIILNVNTKYIRFLGVDNTQIIDKNISHEYLLLGQADTNVGDIMKLVLAGDEQTITTQAEISGQKYTLKEHYTPHFSADELIVGLIKISYVV